jgi:XRE family transcriptional regulator, aerobic/anaerobic benzoate catabolism transcriptional regulator
MASNKMTDNDQAFLAEIGRRVRKVRSIRGLSRKSLSNGSGISERYLAQLEAGLGNVSILLLKKIAAVTGTRTEDLLTDPSSTSPDVELIRSLLLKATPDKITLVRTLLGQPKTDKISFALIGIRGAGKSTLGKAVAERLGYKFIELNKELENESGLPANEIFSLYGLEGFRRFEQAALMRLSLSKEPSILATGGGIVADSVTFNFLLENFKTVWLKASPLEYMERVRAQGDLRPMANDKAAMSELITILENREPLYSQADMKFSNSGITLNDAINKLEALLNSKK